MNAVYEVDWVTLLYGLRCNANSTLWSYWCDYKGIAEKWEFCRIGSVCTTVIDHKSIVCVSSLWRYKVSAAFYQSFRRTRHVCDYGVAIEWWKKYRRGWRIKKKWSIENGLLQRRSVRCKSLAVQDIWLTMVGQSHTLYRAPANGVVFS